MSTFRISAIIILLLLWTEVLVGQFYWFGRNKIQYTDFAWHVLRTENFDIYFYSEMQDLAERGAHIAETSYRELEQKFNHTVSQRIPLIFYSSHLHFQETNITPGFIPEGVGGFFEFIKGRVVIPFNGSFAQFEHVIRHELVHVFMTSKIAQVLRDRRQSADRLPPLWFVEGLAEYWSTNWNTEADMILRDAVLNNYIVGLSHIDRYSGTYLMYKMGQHVVQYIAENFGEDKVLLLLENFWRSNSFSEVMKEVIGHNYRQFDERWLYDLKKQYYPLVSELDLPGMVSTPVVTDGFNLTPIYTEVKGFPEIYFIGNRTGYTSLYNLRLDDPDARPRVVIKGERTGEFESIRLLNNSISISSAGLLAFVTKSGESDVLHIFDIKKNRLIETHRFDDLVMLNSPNWSPDGTIIVFSAADKSGYHNLYTYDREERRLSSLTSDKYDDRDPSWSPDGKLIVFSSDRAQYGYYGFYNLYLYDYDNGFIRKLTYGAHNDYTPTWSPDGGYIVFVSDIDGIRNLWSIPMDRDFDDVVMKKLTRFSTGSYDPNVTAKGDVFFAAYENSRFKLMKMDFNTGLLTGEDRTVTFNPPKNISSWTRERIDSQSDIHITRYKPKYTLDIAQSQISTDPIFGTSGGAILSVSDLLGNDRYNFLIYNTAQTQDEFLESFNVAISRISLLRRTNFAYGIFHFAGRRYDLTDPDLFFYERVFGGYYALSYPLSVFQRVEFTSSVSHSNKESFLDVGERRALLLSGSVSFVHDNSLWGSTGPVDGKRFLARIAYTTDIQYGNVGYYTVMVDYRHYFRLSRRTTYASRFQVYYNDGEEARRYFMGGSWDLRGYPRWSLRGEKLWLTSHEFRFPFIDQLGVNFPFGVINFGSFRGALFFDAGSVWDKEYKQTLGSIGAGVRWNLGGFIVLRYDFGKRIENNFTTLQSGIFHQFFFGWDF